MKSSTAILLLILFVSLVVVPKIGSVKAQDMVYIRADGSVDPSTEFIQRNGDVYTVVGDFDELVVVEKNNTVFDGEGHVVGGVYGPLRKRGMKQWEIDFVCNITVVNTIINGDGIFFLNSSNLIITNNTLNNGRGLECRGNENIITNNTVNSGRGISSNGKRNIISGNRVTNCNYTFTPNNPPPYGISVEGANSTVTGNYVVGTEGTAIRLGTSYYSIVFGNLIANNREGIYTLNIYSQGGARDNFIYHNSFINNTKNVNNAILPAGFNLTGAVNNWDNSTAGNYWSNYNGTDSDGDGVGDTAYIIDENNIDYFPLMEPLEAPELELPDNVPEFPRWTPLLIMLAAVMAVAVIYRRNILNSSLGRRTK